MNITINWRFTLVIILAFLIRCISLNQSLWLDEAVNVTYASFSNLFWYLTKYSIGDFHAPGFFLILWSWVRIFGSTEIAVRLISVIFGVSTVALTYFLGKDLFNKSTGLLAAVLMATAPLHIYYSQEARMYSFSTFSVTLCMYFFIRFIQTKKHAVFGLILSSALVLYSDYLPYLIFPAQFLFLLLHKRTLIKTWLFNMLLAFVLFLPWLVVFPEQLKNGQIVAEQISGWKAVVGTLSIKAISLLWVKTIIGRVSLDNNILYAILITLVSFPYFYILSSLKIKDAKNILLLLWLLIPPIIAIIVSFKIPVFLYFRFTFILPAFYLLLATAILSFKKSLQIIFMILVIMIGVSFSMVYLLDPRFQREDWRGTVSYLQKQSTQNSVVLVKNLEVFPPFAYYNKDDINVLPAIKTYVAKSTQDLIEAEKITGYETIYVLQYYQDISDPQRLVDSYLENLGYRVVDTKDFMGVGIVYIFQKVLAQNLVPIHLGLKVY